MLQNLISQRPDFFQGQSGPILHVVREQANATAANVARKGEGVIMFAGRTGCLSALGYAIGEADALVLGDADDVISISVGCVV